MKAVDHPYLVVYSATAASAARDKAPSFDPRAIEEACGICHDPSEDPVVSLIYVHLFVTTYWRSLGKLSDFICMSFPSQEWVVSFCISETNCIIILV